MHKGQGDDGMSKKEKDEDHTTMEDIGRRLGVRLRKSRSGRRVFELLKVRGGGR